MQFFQFLLPILFLSSLNPEELFQEELFSDALKAYETQSKTNSQDLLRSAQCCLQLKDFSKAINILSQVEGHEEEKKFILAQAYRLSKENEKAIDVLKQIKNLDISFELGLNYFQLKKYPEARFYFLKNSEKKSLFYLGRIYLEENEPMKALESFETIPDVSYWKGIAHTMAKNYPEAVACLENNTEEDARHYLAKNYIKLEQYSKAKKELDLLPKDEKNLLLLLELHCLNKDFEEAKKISEKLTPLSYLPLLAPAAPTHQERADLYKKLIKLDPSPHYWFLKGMNDYDYACQINSKELFKEASEAFKMANASEMHTLTNLILGEEIHSKSDLLLHASATLSYRNNEFEKANETWKELINQYPQSSYVAESLFYQAKCAEKWQNYKEMKEQLLQLYTQFPQSSFAPYAYLNYYSQQEYLNGNRKTLKHLLALPTLFPSHPVSVIGYYLQGLNLKKDRYSDEGKIISHRHLTAAIDKFQRCEQLFNQIENQLADTEKAHLIKIKNRANLEIALTNFNIANDSQGTKKQIYLEYAEEMFNKIKSEELWEEATYYLGKVHLEKGEIDLCEKQFEQMISRYKEAGIDQSYYLFLLWFEKGLIAQKQRNYDKALEYYDKAEFAFDQISPDEKLTLWIEQSQCKKELKEYEEAMKVLSKVVNDEAISSLRVKAMYLRSEIYELLGKPELAKKQLEATSKKGGEWGLKAKKDLSWKFLPTGT